MPRQILHKTQKNLCVTAFCRNHPEPGRRLCSKCRKRARKEINPLSYTYSYIKNNARRRGKEFSLSMDQFIAFVTSTGYMEGKGRTAEKLSIDRIDHRRGYSIDNIQVLTVSANSSKGYHESTDCPF